MADHAECAFEYPNGDAVDCDGPKRPLAAQVPAGWTCVERIRPNGDAFLALWTSRDGAFGAQFQHSARDGKAYFWGSLTDGETSDWLTTTEGYNGFIRFEGSYEGTVHLDASLMHVNATGSPSWLGTEGLGARVSEYNGSAWFVWSFAGNGSEAYLQSMATIRSGSTTSHMPVDLRITGTDFRVDLTARSLFHIGGPITYAPGPLDALTGGPGDCPD